MIQEKVYKSKSSSHFPNFDASNTWQMGHNSRQGFILGQELLSDFAAWINLTSNADNLPGLYQLRWKLENTYCFFKTCWWLTGLSIEGFMMPLNHQAGYKVLKNNAQDISRKSCNASLLSALMLDRNSHVVCFRDNSLYKKSPQIPALYAISLNRYLDFSKN